MSVLDNLTSNQRQILISLPYRVGLLISQSDHTGGDQSGENERQVLANIIHGFTADVFGSELVQLIMRETVAKQAEWPEWSKDVSSVPEDCRIVVDVLRQYADPKDVTAFIMRLMEIAEAVAMAFREYDRMGIGGKLQLYFSYWATKFKKPAPGKARKTLGEYVAISNAERRALTSLANALGTVYV